MPQDTPSRHLPQFMVRFPEGMRERIAEAAKQNQRSMNAEIISRLEESFKNPFDELQDPKTAKQTAGFLKLVLEAVRMSEGSDKVFYIGSRNAGDDPGEDSLLGISEAHPEPDDDPTPSR